MERTKMRSLVFCSCLLLATVVHAEAPNASLAVGKPAPDFTVTGIDGKEFKLSDVTASGKHVALMFSRAHW